MAKAKVKAKAKTKKEEVRGPSRLVQVLASYNQQSDAASQITLLDNNEIIDKSVKPLPSGILSLDKTLGIGGFPQGRIIEVYGSASSGKTSITLHAIAETQRLNGVAAFVDAEFALDVNYAKLLGVQLNKLLLSQPNSGESALATVETLANLLGKGDLIVVDSVSALIPQKEVDGEIGDQFMALQARLMSQAMRKLVSVVSKSGVTVIFINQTRQNLGVTYGSNVTTSGGRALGFAASVRLEVKRTGSNKKGDEIISNKTQIKVVKNKIAPPYKTADTIIKFGKGIPRSSDVLKLAVEEGLVTKGGSWYSYGETKIGQGEELAATYLDDNPELLDKLEQQLRKLYGF